MFLMENCYLFSRFLHVLNVDKVEINTCKSNSIKETCRLQIALKNLQQAYATLCQDGFMVFQRTQKLPPMRTSTGFVSEQQAQTWTNIYK